MVLIIDSDLIEHEGIMYISKEYHDDWFKDYKKTLEDNAYLRSVIKEQNKELTRLRRLERRQQKRWEAEIKS
ncbi:hypothetical protein [Bacillus cereus]|uniref:hypothetical protein n=1 Tax=Bacillus cereus TaxID=1396 RepID=UPI001FB0154E|nr:hypothetical protein [Bacillus cereus]MCJ0846037.1 hypothetical protein [Bacillus cereus]MDF9563405.1 hypothetical protein [Bacillus cereus]